MTTLLDANELSSLSANELSFLESFLERYRNQFEVGIYSECKIEPEFIEVKVKSITPTKNGIDIEFASEEDVKLFRDNNEKIPIRMVLA